MGLKQLLIQISPSLPDAIRETRGRLYVSLRSKRTADYFSGFISPYPPLWRL